MDMLEYMYWWVHFLSNMFVVADTLYSQLPLSVKIHGHELGLKVEKRLCSVEELERTVCAYHIYISDFTLVQMTTEFNTIINNDLCCFQNTHTLYSD